MQLSFLQLYLEAFPHLEGWFPYDAALLFMAYRQLIPHDGDIFEINGYRGAASIALAQLRGKDRKLFVTGVPDRDLFLANMRPFYDETSFVEFAPPRARTCIFARIDGAYDAAQTYKDVDLAAGALLPGGLLAINDYFNPEHPEVAEGVLEFTRRDKRALVPVAIGEKHVLFQKLPGSEINAAFANAFPYVKRGEAKMLGSSVALVESFRPYLDLYASRPQRFVRLGEAGIRAKYSVPDRAEAKPAERIAIPATVTNTSTEIFPSGEGVFGLSYLFYSLDGPLVRAENPHSYLSAPLAPGESVVVDLDFTAPLERGLYRMEVDLLWNGRFWFKEIANPVSNIEVEVRRGEFREGPPHTRYDEIGDFLRTLDHKDEATKTYFEIHLPRLARTLELVPDPRTSKRVLELGAYMQMTPALSAVLGYTDVRGADVGPLGQSKERSANAGGTEIFRATLDLFDAERDRYPYPDAHFEAVLACEIFEHMLRDPMHMLTEIHRILEEGGALVLTTPNVASYTAVARELELSGNPQLFSKFPDPRGEFVADEIPHVREYTAPELKEAVESAGFEIEHLFTEIIPGYGTNERIADLLERLHYPLALRGEQIYCVARKRGAREIVRYPHFLYEGF